MGRASYLAVLAAAVACYAALGAVLAILPDLVHDRAALGLAVGAPALTAAGRGARPWARRRAGRRGRAAPGRRGARRPGPPPADRAGAGAGRGPAARHARAGRLARPRQLRLRGAAGLRRPGGREPA